MLTLDSNERPNNKSLIFEKSKEPRVLEIPHKISVIETRKPAFLQIIEDSITKKPSLLISSFDLFGNNSLKIVKNLDEKIKSPYNKDVELITKDIIWPNKVTLVPKSLFNRELLLVSGGFLHPMFSTGALTFLDPKSKEKIKITEDKKGWFYHKTEFIDIDKNGKMDILSARAKKSKIKTDECGELVWFENPGTLDGIWKEHLISKGPDVNFKITDLNNDGNKQIISTEFFNRTLSISWFENGQIQRKVIDNTIGSPFDLTIADINGDGKPELIVTNHENPNGSVYVYEIPKDFKNGDWKRHEILSGIQTRIPIPHQASPGAPYVFTPHKEHKGKPYILISGDGSTKLHMLVPKSQDPNNFEYDEKIILNTNCTVGDVAIADVDGDGYNEIFVPAYDRNMIFTLSFNPDKKPIPFFK